MSSYTKLQTQKLRQSRGHALKECTLVEEKFLIVAGKPCRFTFVSHSCYIVWHRDNLQSFAQAVIQEQYVFSCAIFRTPTKVKVETNTVLGHTPSPKGYAGASESHKVVESHSERLLNDKTVISNTL
jgi:hypothetical protein